MKIYLDQTKLKELAEVISEVPDEVESCHISVGDESVLLERDESSGELSLVVGEEDTKPTIGIDPYPTIKPREWWIGDRPLGVPPYIVSNSGELKINDDHLGCFLSCHPNA